MFEGLIVANVKIALTTAFTVLPMLAIAIGVYKAWEYIKEEVL